jgi:hypothetical protein
VLYEGKTFRDFFPKTVQPCNEKAILEALQGVGRVTSCTFITTEKGYLGTTTVAAKGGDRIYVVLGCSYPVLVREDGEVFKVVGECYLDGAMGGEALQHVDQGECQVEPIHLK